MNKSVVNSVMTMDEKYGRTKGAIARFGELCATLPITCNSSSVLELLALKFLYRQDSMGG